jgi:hypothetical protein
MRKKRCKSCKEYFIPDRPLMQACSIKCAIDLSNKQRENERKQVHKARLNKMKANDRRHQLKLAQMEFNRFIRMRDDGEPCISCGRHHNGQYHAGHYRSVGAVPALRFNELNCSKQCAPCNAHLSGNIIEYRINLIKKIGIEKVEWLEGEHEPKKYTLEEINDIKTKYRQLCREMKRAA